MYYLTGLNKNREQITAQFESPFTCFPIRKKIVNVGKKINFSVLVQKYHRKKRSTRKLRYNYNSQGDNSTAASRTLVGKVTPCAETNLRPLSQKLFKNRFSAAARLLFYSGLNFSLCAYQMSKIWFNERV